MRQKNGKGLPKKPTLLVCVCVFFKCFNVMFSFREFISYETNVSAFILCTGFQNFPYALSVTVHLKWQLGSC